jgi:protein tyrosine phosphatase
VNQHVLTLVYDFQNQYIFCHDAVLEYVLCGETSVAAHSLRARIKTLSSVNQEEGVSGYKKELKLLAKVSPSESSFTTTEASMPENLNKNRYRGNLPPDGCCVHLSPVVDKPAHFKYINACLLDAYRRRDYYITTQGPLENTVSDFWRMVWEKQCGAIVMLTSVEENGRQMSATYWPTSATLEAGFLTIKLDDETTLEEYTVRTFSIVSQASCGRQCSISRYTLIQINIVNQFIRKKKLVPSCSFT